MRRRGAISRAVALLGTAAVAARVTGRPRDIELLPRRLGFSYVDRKLDADRTNHIRLVLLGNEPYRWWGMLPGADMSSNQITQYLKWMDPGVSGMKTPRTQTIRRRG